MRNTIHADMDDTTHFSRHVAKFGWVDFANASLILRERSTEAAGGSANLRVVPPVVAPLVTPQADTTSSAMRTSSVASNAMASRHEAAEPTEGR